MPNVNTKSEKGGWGCFAPVIIKALNKYLDNRMFAKNLTGLTLADANRLAVNSGFNIKIAGTTQGAGQVLSYKQSIPADTKAETGAIITVSASITFSPSIVSFLGEQLKSTSVMQPKRTSVPKRSA